MFHRFQDRFGTAGVVIAVIALIAALGGTALAASGALTAKQKKEVKAIAKSFQGSGPAGAAGANGAPGAKGENGAPGTPGTNGTSGKEGKEGPEGPEGPPGTPGTNGTNGTDGSPWTAGGTLPKGSTETGAFLASEIGEFAIDGTISFAIPLKTGLGSAHVHYVNKSEWEAGVTGDCAGGTAAAPKAAEGSLCLYEGGFSSPTNGAESPLILTPAALALGTGTAGALLAIEGPPGSRFIGTWAVTSAE